jgi:hypothetical protein
VFAVAYEPADSSTGGVGLQLNEDALCELEQRAAASVQRNAVMKMKMDNRYAIQDNVS